MQLRIPGGIRVLAFSTLFLLSFSEVVYMSSGFCERYAEIDYALYYESLERKSFASDEDSRQYFSDRRREFFRSHRPLFRALKDLLAASKSKIPILPLDLSLPEFREDTQKQKARYPCLCTMLFRSDSGAYRISFTLGQAGNLEMLRHLRQNLENVLKTMAEQDGEESVQAVRSMAPEIIIRDHYAVHVFLPHNIPPESENYFRPLLSRVVQETCQSMDRSLAAPDFMNALDSQPEPIRPVIQAAEHKGYTREMIFRPWGPAVADDLPGLLSLRMEKGQVMIVILMAFKRYDWGKVSLTVQNAFRDDLILLMR